MTANGIPRRRAGDRRGNSLIEFSLLFPWYIFLFAGIFDFGFYAYALIATQSAARVAAVYCSASSSTASDSATACGYALDQLSGMPNVGPGLRARELH
jgi:Flp pilus assembly protein TadG